MAVLLRYPNIAGSSGSEFRLEGTDEIHVPGARGGLAALSLAIPAGAQTISTAAGSTTWGGAIDVAVDASGNMYVADYLKHSVYKIDRLANVTTIAGTGVGGSSGRRGTRHRALSSMVPPRSQWIPTALFTSPSTSASAFDASPRTASSRLMPALAREASLATAGPLSMPPSGSRWTS